MLTDPPNGINTFCADFYILIPSFGHQPIDSGDASRALIKD